MFHYNLTRNDISFINENDFLSFYMKSEKQYSKMVKIKDKSHKT